MSQEAGQRGLLGGIPGGGQRRGNLCLQGQRQCKSAGTGGESHEGACAPSVSGVFPVLEPGRTRVSCHGVCGRNVSGGCPEKEGRLLCRTGGSDRYGAGGRTAVSPRKGGRLSVPGREAGQYHSSAGRQGEASGSGLCMCQRREKELQSGNSGLRRSGTAGGERDSDSGLRCVRTGQDSAGDAGR